MTIAYITVDPNQNTVELSISDHPKCEDLVIDYGRWLIIRIQPQGVSSKDRSSDTSFFLAENLLPAILRLCIHVFSCCY